MLLENLSLFRNLFYSVELAHPDTFFGICVVVSCCNLNVTMCDTEIRIAKTAEPQEPRILSVKVVLERAAQLAFVQRKRCKGKSQVNVSV
jgi:hypothetical protein